MTTTRAPGALTFFIVPVNAACGSCITEGSWSYAVLCCGMVGPAMSAENDHRCISIRNTDSSWVKGVCSLVFRLDNGRDGTFNNLMVSLQLTDKSGAVLEKGTLDVQPFGDSSATR
ncbi:IrmA family protein [Citrobacter europaeus]|uniref:IrmA family protein n=1 Tax=Citrobacter europaeus TaxID=1914243 RepID=UPI000F4F3737|nr:IrmA family protein [Citrobacter europaeus]